MAPFSKSTESSFLVWLRFVNRKLNCGKKVYSWRLIEYDPETKKVIYVFPQMKVATPPLEFLEGRGYRTTYQTNPPLNSDPDFMRALGEAAAIPMGVIIV